MECSLAALLLCFSWSNLYIDAQVAVQDARYAEQTEILTREEIMYGFGQPTITSSESRVASRSNEAANPYMRNAIGYQITFRQLDVAAEIFHDSSMATDRDRGVNGIAIRARWFPFRR